MSNVIEHPLATIEREQQGPMQAPPIANAGKDAQVSALVLVAEVFAQVDNVSSPWTDFSYRLINGTTDFREEYSLLSGKKKAAYEAEHVIDKKSAASVRSDLVNVTRLTTIAKAFNKGASMAGMCDHYKANPEDIKFRRIYDYAVTFSQGQAGRKPDTLAVRFDKWITSQEKKTDLTDEDVVLITKIRQWEQAQANA